MSTDSKHTEKVGVDGIKGIDSTPVWICPTVWFHRVHRADRYGALILLDQNKKLPQEMAESTAHNKEEKLVANHVGRQWSQSVVKYLCTIWNMSQYYS